MVSRFLMVMCCWFVQFGFSQNKPVFQHHLESVLTHYETRGDTLKYKAAVFLLKHMPIHEFYDYKWTDLNGEDVLFEETDYPNAEAFLEVLNRLKDSIGIKTIVFKRKDTEAMTPELLIRHIDLAFLEWQNNPWSQKYSFDVFCEYILPYRSLVEPLSDWRANYKALVKEGAKNATNPNDPVEVATHTILELSEFVFPNAIPSPIPLLGPNHLLFRKQGSCPDLANLALFACRAIGLAVSFDFTPHHAASSNRHFWNTIIDADGKHIPFNGNAYGDTKGLPGVYSPNNKRIGKVFRRTFSGQEQALANGIPLQEIPDGFLRSYNILDVTNSYVPTGSFNYRLTNNKIAGFAFLNVFNHGKWRVVDGVKKQGKLFPFKDLGTDIVYLVSTYNNDTHYYENYPVLIDVSKKEHYLKPNMRKGYDVMLSRSNEFTPQYRDTNSLDITEGAIYTLYYWQGGWQKLQTATANRKGVYFKDVPQNALFWLLPEDNDGFERIFTIDKRSKKIRWY